MIQGQKNTTDPATPTSRNEEELAERLSIAVKLLDDSVEIDRDVRGGVPVVRGTRISVARILAEVADDHRLSEVADSLDIDVKVLTKIIEGLSIHLDRPVEE